MAGVLGRITSKGTLPSGEVFAYAMCISRADAGTMTLANVIAAADAWQNTLKTGGTPIVAQYSNATAWSTCTADIIDPSSGAVLERGFGSVVMAGTAGGSVTPLPPGVAVAVTLRSTTAGPTGRGRFYLPPPQTPGVSLTGRMGAPQLAAISGALANGFTALAGLANPIHPAIFSKTHHTFHLCIKGDVGDVYDSMRTRRDKLVETRSPLFSY